MAVTNFILGWNSDARGVVRRRDDVLTEREKREDLNFNFSFHVWVLSHFGSTRRVRLAVYATYRRVPCELSSSHHR